MARALDTPWRRPGRLRYALARLRSAAAPPVTVTDPPGDIVVGHDLEVTTRDGTVLRVNVFRPRGQTTRSVLLCAHPYGKDNLPRRRRGRWTFSPQYRAAPADPGELLGADVLGGARPVLVGGPRLRGDQRRPAGLRNVGRHRRAVVTPGGRGHLRHRRLGRRTAVERRSGGDVGGVVSGHLAVRGGRPAFPGPEGDHPVGGLLRRLPRPRLPRRGPGEGLHPHVGCRNPAHHPAELRHHRDGRRAPAARRLLAVAGARCLGDHGADAGVRQLLRPQSALAGFVRAFQQTSSRFAHLYTHRGGKWATYYSAAARAAQLAFVRTALDGTGSQSHSRTVRLEVREDRDTVAAVREEFAWPLERTEWRRLYLAGPGQLSNTAPGQPGSIPFQTRSRAAIFTWTVPDDTELSGPMAARL